VIPRWLRNQPIEGDYKVVIVTKGGPKGAWPANTELVAEFDMYNFGTGAEMVKKSVGKLLSSGWVYPYLHGDGVVKIIDPAGIVCVRVVVSFGDKTHDSNTRSAGRSKT